MTSVTDVNTENQTSSASGGLPLRGLAMVLIAIAVLLGLWGLYALTQNDEATDTADTVQTAETAPVEPGTQAPGDGTGGDEATESDPADQESPAEAGEPEEATAEREDHEARTADGAGAEADRAEAPADRGAGADAAPVPEPAKLHVLNNSTVSNLAADVSEELRDRGYELGEVGNFADEIFPETTVFFQPGNTEAEGEARELASRLDGVAREYVDSLPEETTGDNDLTLVLVREVIL